MLIETNKANGDRVVSQKGYRMEMLVKYRVDANRIKSVIKTPAADNLITGVDESEAYESPTHYLSIVMAIMYLARFTRPEVLLLV